LNDYISLTTVVCFAVTARFETQRWGIISSFIHPSRFLFVLCHGALGAVMVGFSCSFSYNHFSAYSVACTADSGTYTARYTYFLCLFINSSSFQTEFLIFFTTLTT